MSLGDWEPLWLGPPTRRLYAALHGVTGKPPVGVVLVPPLLHELSRSRRFLAETAVELAAMGLPCLRFDFFGTGDSGGDGEVLDFASMHQDLDLAVAAIRERTSIERLALVAWRGSALVVREWLAEDGQVDLVVLWEPIRDGSVWLRELIEGDARERALRPPPRPGIARFTDSSDGQLMGFPASPRFRADLARARLGQDEGPPGQSAWAVLRANEADLPLDMARVLRLPESAPVFDLGAAMDATFFLTPPVRDTITELGRAMRREAWA